MAERPPDFSFAGKADISSAQIFGPDVSCDSILGGSLKLLQPLKGHRAGTDAILLAAAAPAEVCGLALDAGAGVGTVGLSLAARCPSLNLGLIENDPKVAALATANLSMNGFAGRGRVYEVDILSAGSRRASGLSDGMAELVLTNPPFADPTRVRASPFAGKRSAHVMMPRDEPRNGGQAGSDPLTLWIRACLALLSPGGIFVMIHRPEALREILVAFGHRIGGVSILPVHPQKDKVANRILIRGKKGSRAPLAMAPPLVLQDEGRFTPRIEAIHRGEALFDW
jgi:tRNA1(Val) A37 N6-methylase TrmN6